MTKSLLGGGNTPPAKEREPLTTESAVRDKQRKEANAYQRENRKKHLAFWNEEKAAIENMSSTELELYLDCWTSRANDTRVGLHSMKLNPYEYALLQLALKKTGARSSKDLYFEYLKKVVNDEQA